MPYGAPKPLVMLAGMLPEINQNGVQPNAPVALVTMEIRHPATDSLTESASREIKHLLINDLPIERQAQDVSWGMTAPGAPRSQLRTVSCVTATATTPWRRL